MSRYKGEKWVHCATEEDFNVQQWPAVQALLVELGIDHSTMLDSIKSVVYGVLGYITPHSDYDRQGGSGRDPWFITLHLWDVLDESDTETTHPLYIINQTGDCCGRTSS